MRFFDFLRVGSVPGDRSPVTNIHAAHGPPYTQQLISLAIGEKIDFVPDTDATRGLFYVAVKGGRDLRVVVQENLFIFCHFPNLTSFVVV